MNAKILQMQNKKAKLFKLKKTTDQSGGGGAAAAGPARSQSLSSLYDLVTGAGQEETHLVTATVTYDSLGSTAVAGAGAGAGLLVTADLPGPGGLRQGDRFLSINERNVFNIGAEEWAHLRWEYSRTPALSNTFPWPGWRWPSLWRRWWCASGGRGRGRAARRRVSHI